MLISLIVCVVALVLSGISLEKGMHAQALFEFLMGLFFLIAAIGTAA